MPLMIASPLPISDEQRAALEVMACSSSLLYRKVVQSRALLFAADGVAMNEVAPRCGDLGGVGSSVAATFRRAGCGGCWPDRAWTRPSAVAAGRDGG